MTAHIGCKMRWRSASKKSSRSALPMKLLSSDLPKRTCIPSLSRFHCLKAGCCLALKAGMILGHSSACIVLRSRHNPQIVCCGTLHLSDTVAKACTVNIKLLCLDQTYSIALSIMMQASCYERRQVKTHTVFQSAERLLPDLTNAMSLLAADFFLQSVTAKGSCSAWTWV